MRLSRERSSIAQVEMVTRDSCTQDKCNQCSLIENGGELVTEFGVPVRLKSDDDGDDPTEVFRFSGGGVLALKCASLNSE